MGTLYRRIVSGLHQERAHSILRGYFAWLFLLFAHVYFLISFRNRYAVLLDWAWSYSTFNRTRERWRGQRPNQNQVGSQHSSFYGTCAASVRK